MNPLLVKLVIPAVMCHMALGCYWHHGMGSNQDCQHFAVGQHGHDHGHAHDHHDHSNTIPHDPPEDPEIPVRCCESDDCSWLATHRYSWQPELSAVCVFAAPRLQGDVVFGISTHRPNRDGQRFQQPALPVRAHLAICVLIL